MAKKVSTKKKTTIPSYTFADTSDPNVKRFIDLKGDWTHYWLVKEKKFVKAVNHILSLGYNKGPRFRAYLETHTKEEIRTRLTNAGDEGSRTHHAIKNMIEGMKITMMTKYPSEVFAGRQEVLNQDEWENLLAFQRWCNVYQPRVIAIEQTLGTEDFGGFAGTYDALLIITVPAGDKCMPKTTWGMDVLLLPDWKSSSGIWNEYESQLAAYWYLIKQSHKYDKFIKAFEGRIYSGIVRVGTAHKIGYEFEVWNEEEMNGGNFERFLAARTIADRHEPEFDPKIIEIPMEISVKLSKATLKSAKKTNTK